MQERVVLLGPDGRPIKAQQKMLEREEASAHVGTNREPVFQSVLQGLNPGRMVGILNDAVESDPADFFALAEEMEERDLHYFAVLGTRKRAVTKLQLSIEAVDGSAEEKKIAAAADDLIKRSGIRTMRKNMMDALGKSVSVIEQKWLTDTEDGLWRPVEWKWRDQRFFNYDKETRSKLQLKEGDNLKQLTPGKYIVHAPTLKSGLQIRSGLARMAAFCFMMKSYTLKDWMAFLEVFGMPLRVGRYDGSASEEDKRRLLRAVLSIAADAGAIIPKGMEIEFISAQSGRGEAVFGNTADYLDKQLSKGVLGQTMTTDDGSSLGQAKVHDEVRDDIRDDDAADHDETLQRDLIEPFINVNFGVRKKYPQVKSLIPEVEDIEALSSALGTLVPYGLRVKQSQVRDKLGLEHPEDDDEILVVGETSSEQPKTEKAANKRETGRTTSPADDLEEIASDELDNWELTLGPILKPIIEAAENSQDYDAFLSKIDALIDDDTDKELVLSLARSMAKAHIHGAADG